MDRFIIKEFNCDSTWEWYVVIALESDMLEKIDWVCHWNFHFKKHEKKDVIQAKIMQSKLNRYDFWWFILLCNILHNILYYTWRMCHFLVYFASLVGFIFNFRTGPRFVPGRSCSWRGKMQQADTISYHKIARWMDVLTVEFFASTGFV